MTVNRKTHLHTSPLLQPQGFANYFNSNFLTCIFYIKTEAFFVSLVVTLKSCGRGVVRLKPNFTFWFECLGFKIQKSCVNFADCLDEQKV